MEVKILMQTFEIICKYIFTIFILYDFIKCKQKGYFIIVFLNTRVLICTFFKEVLVYSYF